MVSRSGPKGCLKESILNDLVAFGLFDNTKLFRGNEAEVRWTQLVEIAENRAKWRAAVKMDGVEFCMST